MMHHPWKKELQILDQDYLRCIGIDTSKYGQTTLETLEEASRKAIVDYKSIGRKPPLISNYSKLDSVYIDIPLGHQLPKHGNCDGCPDYIKEIIPVKYGCQLNCQYCLVVSNKSVQTRVEIFKNYAPWLTSQLKANRVKKPSERGTLYYWSPKTDAFSPEMITSGIAHEILQTFANHVLEEQKRLKSDCPDTLFIVTKAGVQELTKKNSKGISLLDLMVTIPDNLQVNGSIAYLGENKELREAIEPGARSEEDRLEFLKLLQKNGILANGLLLEPIILPFVPPRDYLIKLKKEIGVKRIAVDILTTTIQSLAVTCQIIGWYTSNGEKKILEAYLPQSAPEKTGNRRSISVDLQRKIYNNLLLDADELGIDAVYCRWVQQTTGMPNLSYHNYKANGCMGYVSPTPSSIRFERSIQLNS